MTTRTVEQVKAELARKGVSIAEWAEANELRPLVAYRVLSGRYKATRGQAHRAAVLLGLKQGEIVDRDGVKQALAA
jgi:gp16 family phage-associated protein